MIKILGVPGDKVQGACAFYRVIWPLEELQNLGLAEVYVPQAKAGQLLVEFDLKGRKNLNRPNMANNYDLVVFQRQPEQRIQALMKHCQNAGIKAVYDIDDAALSIPKTNPNYCTWGRDKRHVEQMARLFIESGHIPDALKGKTAKQAAEQAPKRLHQLLLNMRQADLVTVTTDALKDEYHTFNSNISVCPNQAKPDHWADAKRIEHPGEVWFGWAGGWTHGRDLSMLKGAVGRLIDKYPTSKFVLIGFEQARSLIFDAISDDRIITFPWHRDFAGYHDAVASLDIVLAPSYSCQFNEAKSDIRILEAWLCKLPCVTSLVTYGDTVRKSGGGLIAKNPKDWIKAIGKLIDNPGLRTVMGQKGYEYVMKERTYAVNAYRWWKAYSGLFEGG